MSSLRVRSPSASASVFSSCSFSICICICLGLPVVANREVLIAWEGLPDHDASWETLELIAQKIPDFHLEDKVKLLHWMFAICVCRYLLKSSLVSTFSELALKPSTSDLGALQQLLVDQPNIPKEEGRL
ncbi:hypothetical protein Patl1_15656 [Pistacia atlantica]|uniref:Uncharacterized protein n=1 Tax=Pistacia atlantica TaxID=434234 RepID=A0ACC1B894_9ROSI|nr:hypothetical protein Patl1_15656 [Pistacia atlantica]